MDRKRLLADLKGLMKRGEADLRERAEPRGAWPEFHERLTAEYEKARTAERTAVAFEEWRGEQIAQKAAAWLLSCVFARFLEDNALVDPPRISGPGDRLRRARDEHELYFRDHPTETDREYLLATFEGIRALPAGEEIFGPHNAIHLFPGWLGGDMAGELLAFFQRIDPETGELVHDFTDPKWDTRFLADLYQDLSELAKKKYALLQTPDFVEAFILDRTLEPAIEEFGLNAGPVKGRGGEALTGPGFRMIDPACGPGHFLLGAFDRILDRWQRREPATSVVELVNRALASVHGVDINPFAVGIAKFRLLLRAMAACGRRRLADCPNFALNLACGDSLLHGEGFLHQASLPLETETGISHWYETEDWDALRRILRIGVYHAVVANPPYITVKDKAVNQACRLRYPEVCHMKYSLAVPFMERIFTLACEGGFTGQITSNSFMKREFGRKLIEGFLPTVDLTHVIDTAGAYIPGHGTPTVILFGRNRKPVASTVRTVMGITGEPATPDKPSEGLVWKSILSLIDWPDKQNDFISVSEKKRTELKRHPWSLTGGGASELKMTIGEKAVTKLKKKVFSIGPSSFTGIDEMFFVPDNSLWRDCISKELVRLLCSGEQIRNWRIDKGLSAFVPYDNEQNLIDWDPFSAWFHRLWPYRSNSEGMISFSNQTRKMLEEVWWSWYRWIPERYRVPLSIAYAEVATHNHFVLDRGGKVFKQTAPVIKLPESATEDEHLKLVGLLNSSTACFWLKQVAHNKGSTVDDRGARQRTAPFEDFFAFNGTRLREFPIPPKRPLALPKKIDELARELSEFLPTAIASKSTPTPETLQNAKTQAAHRIAQMIALQEELDWQCYGFYGLLAKDEADSLVHENPPEIALGQRAFEIVMARQMAAGELETTWFKRHNSTPITEIPAHWPKDYRELVEKRIRIIAENPRTIGLIEKPEYKRRWNLEPWDRQLETALWSWLLDRMESYFDFDGRMNDAHEPTERLDGRQITTVARLADIARADEDFMKVAELYRNRADFDVPALVGELVNAETVPLLPACRYKPAGLDKRAAWERTWELQRLEDAIDALFDLSRLLKQRDETLPPDLRREIEAVHDRVLSLGLMRVDDLVESKIPAQWLEDEVREALESVRANRRTGNPETDPIFKDSIENFAHNAKGALVGDIPVPPKYAGKDFQQTHFWRLRGKLDVPKERWVGFPHCEGEDQSAVIAWAGADHLQLAQAVSTHFVHIQEVAGGSGDPRLEILLACLLELLPWIKQWHNDLDPEFNLKMGDFFEDFIAEEARRLDKTTAEIAEWNPPKTKPGKKKSKTPGRKAKDKETPA